MQSLMETDAGDQVVASAAHEAAAALPNDTAAVRRCLCCLCIDVFIACGSCALRKSSQPGLKVVMRLLQRYQALLQERCRDFWGAEQFCLLHRRLRKPAKQRRSGSGLGGLSGRWRSG